MISLIEVLRVNKPVLITVDWDDPTNQVSFYCSSVKINGQDLDVKDITVLWDIRGDLLITAYSVMKQQKLWKLINDSNIPFIKISGQICIKSTYVQVLNPQ
jgi:hypothetical protein